MQPSGSPSILRFDAALRQITTAKLTRLIHYHYTQVLWPRLIPTCSTKISFPALLPRDGLQGWPYVPRP